MSDYMEHIENFRPLYRGLFSIWKHGLYMHLKPFYFRPLYRGLFSISGTYSDKLEIPLFSSPLSGTFFNRHLSLV